jgi:hypothetical protein
MQYLMLCLKVIKAFFFLAAGLRDHVSNTYFIGNSNFHLFHWVTVSDDTPILSANILQSAPEILLKVAIHYKCYSVVGYTR